MVGLGLPLQAVQFREHLSVGCPRLLDPVLVEELVTTLSQETTSVPLWEVVLFLVLSAITYYRKKLSSNRVYMEEDSPPQGGNAASSSPRLSSFPPEPMSFVHQHAGTGEAPATPGIDLDSALAAVPSILPAKLKNIQMKLLRTIALQAGLEEAVRTRQHGDDDDEDDLLTSLPQDGLIQVMRFLQPQNVLELGQASRSLRDLCHRPQVWRAMWLRRFGQLWDSTLAEEILTRRHIHVKARQIQVPDWKLFYFLFEQCWVDWLLAGYNAEERCLVGLHGEVYDLTSFLNIHPGSKETIMVNAGSDATSFFEDVGHSNQARALMKDFVVLAPSPEVSRCFLVSVATSYCMQKKQMEQALMKTVAEGGDCQHDPAGPVQQDNYNNNHNLHPTNSNTNNQHHFEGEGLRTCQACGGASYSMLPFGGTTPCAGGLHVGLCHGVCDPLLMGRGAGSWFAWWSCCGLVVVPEL